MLHTLECCARPSATLELYGQPGVLPGRLIAASNVLPHDEDLCVLDFTYRHLEVVMAMLTPVIELWLMDGYQYGRGQQGGARVIAAAPVDLG